MATKDDLLKTLLSEHALPEDLAPTLQSWIHQSERIRLTGSKEMEEELTDELARTIDQLAGMEK
jgi:hypothetical protein